MTLRTCYCLTLLVILNPVSQLSFAQEKGTRLQQMSQRVRQLPLMDVGRNEKLFVKPQPLLRYSSPESTTIDGTLWVWTRDKCPMALTAVFLDSRPEFRWNYECVSLTSDRVSLTSPKGWQWTPRKEKPAWHKVDMISASETSTARLTQMRSIARTFKGSHDLDGNRLEYRLLPTPVLRYASKKDDVLDGALFLLVAGTNPEIVVQLETTQASKNYRVAFARLTAAAVVVRKNDKVVWEAPRVRSWKPTNSYFSHYGPDE